MLKYTAIIKWHADVTDGGNDVTTQTSCTLSRPWISCLSNHFSANQAKIRKTENAKQHNWSCKHLGTLLLRRYSVLLIGQSMKLLYITTTKNPHQLWNWSPAAPKKNECHHRRRRSCLGSIPQQHPFQSQLITHRNEVSQGLEFWNKNMPATFEELLPGKQYSWIQGKVNLLKLNPHTVNSFWGQLKMSRKITSSMIRQI